MRHFGATCGLAFSCFVVCAACSSHDGSSGAAGSSGAGATASGGGPVNTAGTTGAPVGGTANGGSLASGGSTTNGGSSPTGGAVTSGGNVGTSGNAGAGSGGVSAQGPSGLPVPPGAGNVPKPSGAAANLKVVPWAGFAAAASYTFDDSQPSQFEHWPELKATGAPVTYFITTANSSIAGYDATLKEVAATGGELGNHTVNHCNYNLTNCAGPKPLPTIAEEIDGCTDYLQKKLGQKDTLTIAYPYGDAAYEADSKTRFFLGRGVGGGLISGTPDDKTDPFNLPIVAAGGGESADVFSGHVDDAHTQKKWVIFLFHSLGPTTATWYATVDIGSVIGSIEHAKSLPDLWLDTMGNVGAYWLAAKLIQGAGPTWTWTLPAHYPAGKYLRVTVDGGTLSQAGKALDWDPHGYYEVALDAGTLAWAP
jgi:peptidoglycan/xylan/chitin deacetylase (PgdA/CDA1 family)